MIDLAQLARGLRRSAVLSDPRRLCAALGIDKDAKRQTGGLIIRCPSHEERNASCSVTVGPDGTVRARCFACDWTADAIGLIEVAMGLPFRDAIDAACDLAGVPRPSGDHAPRVPIADRVRRPADVSEPEARYPAERELTALWESARPVGDSPIASGHLEARGFDVAAVDARGLALALWDQSRLPGWARYRGEAEHSSSWLELGYLIILRTYDHDGQWRSVRAWRVLPGSGPKRLPPSGCTATGLVLANSAACALLRGETGPTRVLVVEGEPDWLTWSCRVDIPVIGILSGAWNEKFGAKIPLGSTVIIRTHLDDHGEKYARDVARTVKGRAHIRRLAA
jgi:hypothetical protein